MKKILPAILIMLILSGCSFNLSDIFKEEQKAATEPIPTGLTAEPTVSDTLNLALCGKPEFQPHAEMSDVNRNSLSFIYEPLFYVDAALAPIPALATGLETHGNSVDINIRENVLWHDGTHFTAADAAYSINLVAGNYSSYTNSDIINAKVKNNGCVTVNLKRSVPNPELLFTFPIVKNKAPQNMNQPNGTGPFMYFGKESYDTYVFGRFDGYYGQKPTYTTVRMINARDEDRVKQLFDAGETDFFVIDSNSFCSYTPRANTKMFEYPLNTMVYIGFNTERIPVGVRRSVHYALDSAALTEKIFSHTAQSVNVPIIPSSPLSSERNDDNSYSIEQAETEMFAAGYERRNGMYYKGNEQCVIRFIVENDDKYEELFDNISKDLQNFGIKCVKETTDFYYERLNSRDFDAVIGSWQTDTDMSVILANGNVFSYENTELQSLITAWGETKNSDINAAFDIIEADVPIIPIAFRKTAVSLSPKITTTATPSYAFPLYGAAAWILK